MVLPVSGSQSFLAFHREVLGSLLFILYTSEMFELMENRLYAYVDDSTLLADVRKPADTPAVAASLRRDLAWIQKWCNHWCMILNLKTLDLVVSRSRTVNPPMVTWSCVEFLFALVPTSTFFWMKFDSKLTFEDHVRSTLLKIKAGARGRSGSLGQRW